MKSLLKIGMLVLIGLSGTACELRQQMYNQPKYKPFSESDTFADKRSSRPLVEGTVPRGHLNEDDLMYRGSQDGKPAAVYPMKIGKAELDRGRERYDIYCSTCHGNVGTGDGVIVQRGFPAPASFHSDALRAAPVGHFFEAISKGWGVMYPMTQIPVEDRWKIVAYIRALQFSQHATTADVPPEAMATLREHKR